MPQFSSPEALVGERLSGSGFQIAFKFLRFKFIGEGVVRYKRPGRIFRGMSGPARIMQFQPLL